MEAFLQSRAESSCVNLLSPIGFRVTGGSEGVDSLKESLGWSIDEGSVAHSGVVGQQSLQSSLKNKGDDILELRESKSSILDDPVNELGSGGSRNVEYALGSFAHKSVVFS